MKNSGLFCLGIDTSNYTTSAAVVDEELNIVCESREILKVKQGERGLRQSQALFEHVMNLPEIIEGMKIAERGIKINAIAVSDRPRRVEGSYMPVFRAGQSPGRILASVMGVKYYEFSHQEGHIEAAKLFSGMSNKPAASEFISLHLSGGTTEMLKCSEDCENGGYVTEIIGGTGDLSLGQLIDRVGVSLGQAFPCGRALDCYAAEAGEALPVFCRIFSDNGRINVSGIETQIQRYIEEEKKKNGITTGLLSRVSGAMFLRVGEAIESIIMYGRKTTGIQNVLAAGGVASSETIRKMLSYDEKIFFGRPELSSDQAVGTAVLGMKKYLKEVFERSI